MKATLAKDLVIGKIYGDYRFIDKDSAFLKFKGLDNDNDLLFEQVGGVNRYNHDEDGTVGFACGDEIRFYELTEQEIEQYLPKEKL